MVLLTAKGGETPMAWQDSGGSLLHTLWSRASRAGLPHLLLDDLDLDMNRQVRQRCDDNGTVS